MVYDIVIHHITSQKPSIQTQTQQFGAGAGGKAAAQWGFQTAAGGILRLVEGLNQIIFSREKFQENPIFHGKIYGFRLRCSLKPTHWMKDVERSMFFFKFLNAQNIFYGMGQNPVPLVPSSVSRDIVSQKS